MPRKVIYKPFGIFPEYHSRSEMRRCVFGGYGSAKTTSLIYDMLMLSHQNYGLPGGLLCPTLKMFKRDCLPAIKENANKNGIPFKYKRADSELFFPDTETTIYIFHGEDNGESIRGPNLAFMCINEVTLLSKETYDAAIARVRHPNAKRLSMSMSGTFEGNTELYDAIVEDPQCWVGYASSRDNPYLPKAYIKSLEASYDEDLVKQYIDGIPVVNMSKKALRKFSMDLVAPVEYNKDYPIWMTIDFNVDPMSAILWNKYPDIEEGPPLRAFREFCLRDSGTQELCDAFKEQGFDPKNTVVFPDPAGNSRTTKAQGTTDLSILRLAGFEDIRYKTQISIRDSLNAANNLMSKKMVQIDPSCKEFIKDCQRVELKPGTNIIDKSDLRRTHWLDGFKNMAEYEYPIKAVRGGWKEVKIR